MKQPTQHLPGILDIPVTITKNQLIYGDNLTVMRSMPNACVDLIYLDPPWNSKRTYNLIYKRLTGQPVPEQEEAFCDTWEMDPEKEEMARRMPIVLRDYGVDDELVLFWKAWIDALRHTQPRLLAYLIYMTYRLFEMRRLLKPTGSIYLHCDPTVSHYIKVILDGVFGHNKFQNEIIWYYRGGGASKQRFARKHEVLLYYRKGEKWTFNLDSVRTPYSDDVLKSSPSRYDKSYRGDKVYSGYKPNPLGKIPDDVWPLQPLMPSDKKERLGYPTQKPIALLRRIISASSMPNEVVFDPFCGCGTTIYAAHLEGRKWIGCDIAILAVRLIRDVLLKRYGLKEDEHYEVSGVPLSIEGAQDLLDRDPRQFQNWAVELVGGFSSAKYSGDRGIDGRIHFETKEGLKNMILSVKGGKLSPAYVRELRGTLEREPSTEMAGLICLQNPTKGMAEEAAQAGIYMLLGTKYDRLQIRTIQEILDGKGFDTPSKVKILGWRNQGALPI
jgi:site-specific DNA-methyltransferase (adenine-specific)